MLSVRPDRPVDPLTLTVMREVDKILRQQGIEYFLCGAMARDILLRHVHGIETGIATVDVDFGVVVQDWNQFEKLKAQLSATGRFDASERLGQRLYYKIDGKGKGYPVDIIPFGGVEGPPNSIAWPPDRDVVMNVIGYEEALANIVQTKVDGEFVVPVISLPGLALLKLFAWADRGAGNPKDALDLVTLFLSYYEAGNQDRLYGEEIRLLERAGFDLVEASPQLLGKDVRRIAGPETLKQILGLLGDARLLDRLVTNMAPRLRARDDPIADAERLLAQFKVGLSEE